MRNLIIALLLLSTTLCAQKSTKSVARGQSPWQLAVSFGLDLKSSRNQPDGEPEGSRLTQLDLTYRISRFFDLGLQLGKQRESGSGYRIVELLSDNRAVTSVWNRRHSNLLLGAEPRFNLRLGQGDLTLGFGAGLVSHRNVTHVNGPGVYNIRAASRRLLGYYYQAGASYTYWPTRRFGVIVSFDSLNMRHGTLSNNQTEIEGVARYMISSTNLLLANAEVSQEDIVPLLGEITPSANGYLSFGLLFRL